MTPQAQAQSRAGEQGDDSEAEAPALPEPTRPEPAQPASTPPEPEALAACRMAAAPLQYGGPKFQDIQAEQAVTLCQTAGEAEDLSPAQRSLAFAFAGRALERQGKLEAAEWLYRRAVADGQPPAFGLLAHRLMRSDGAALEAATIAQQGHTLGDRTSGNVLASLYAQDRVPGKDKADALALAETLAEADDAYAQYLTGWLYEVHADQPDTALVWYQRASDAGETAATAFMAELIERKALKTEGLTQDQREAELRRAADLYWQAMQVGNAWVYAQFTESPGQRDPLVVQRIQESLAKAGFDVGTPDGVYGPRTQAALQAFAEQQQEAEQQ